MTTNDNDFETKNRPVNKSNDSYYQGQSIIKMVLIFDIIAFLVAGLICLMKPEIVNEWTGLEPDLTEYLGYALLASAFFTAIAMRFILKKKRQN